MVWAVMGNTMGMLSALCIAFVYLFRLFFSAY